VCAPQLSHVQRRSRPRLRPSRSGRSVLITPEQVNAALQAQSKSTQIGKPISVAEAFVQLAC
jgi:hypothetical protein